MTLQDVADISQAVTVLVVAAGLFYASRQLTALREQAADSARTQRLQATRDFLDIIAVNEVRATRRWLLSTQPCEHTAAERHEEIMRLAVAYDRLGLMIVHELLDRDFVYSWQGPEIARLWHLVKTKVIAERQLPGRQLYCIYFEQMAQLFTITEAGTTAP